MKPRVLILGGCGFIGRNLVDHLIREDLSSEVRVVDKVPPQTAWLSPSHKDSFNNLLVYFQSANLLNTEACKGAFHREDGEKWDWVVDCASETRRGLADPLYEEGIYKTHIRNITQAAECGAHNYLILSHCMSNNKKVPHRENEPVEPVTVQGKWLAKVEAEIVKTKHLFDRCIVLRPAIVYGSGDRTGLISLLMLGAIYRNLGEPMRLLWSRGRPMNTVHVKDVCRAVVHLFTNLPVSNSVQIYHVADDSSSTQGSICDAISAIFGIECCHAGTMLSTVAKLDFNSLAEEINDKHLAPWADLCFADNVINTPLTPYLTPDILQKTCTYMDSTKLKESGFHFAMPTLEISNLRKVVEEYAEMGLFPKSSLS